MYLKKIINDGALEATNYKGPHQSKSGPGLQLTIANRFRLAKIIKWL